MVRRIDRLIDRLVFRRTLARWAAAAAETSQLSPSDLRLLRGRARDLRREVDRVLHRVDDRLALPAIGAAALRRPIGTDWIWRPDLWTGPIPVPGQASVAGKTPVCDGTTLFHDCRRSELSIRQIRNTRAEDIAPFGFRIDVFRFDGSFLSLVLDLPDEAALGLGLRHLIRLDAVVEVERPLDILARLNVKHGPNVEQIVRDLPLRAEEVMVEFDLAYTRINEKRIEKLWIDLIFEGPEMNQVILRDVTVSRRPRAEI